MELIQSRIDVLKIELRRIFKTFKSAEDDTSTTDDLDDDLIGLDELLLFLEGTQGEPGALAEGSSLNMLLSDVNIAPAKVKKALKLMPTQRGKVNTELFMKEVFDMDRPAARLDILELKTLLLNKQEEVFTFTDQTH